MHFEGPADVLMRAWPHLAAMGLGGYLRGMPTRPGGGRAGEALPGLPVAPWQRIAARVLVAEVLLLGVTAAVGLGMHAAVGAAPPTNPFAGAGVAPGALVATLAPKAVLWAPLAAVGASGERRLAIERLAVAVVVAANVSLSRADETVPSALYASALATLVVVGLARKRGRPDDWRRRGASLDRLSLDLKAALAAGGAAILALGSVLLTEWSLGGAPDLRTRLYAVGGTAAAVLLAAPVLPPTARGALPEAEASFRLPVDRLRLTLASVGASLRRAIALLAVLATVVLWARVATGPLAGRGDLALSDQGNISAFLLCAAAAAGAFASLSGKRWGLLPHAVGLCALAAVLLLLGVAFGARPQVVWIGMDVSLVAVAAVAVAWSAGWLGRSPRALG